MARGSKDGFERTAELAESDDVFDDTFSLESKEGEEKVEPKPKRKRKAKKKDD